MGNELKQTFKWFKEHHNEIFAQYPNSFVVIRDEAVLFSAPSFEDAMSIADSQGLEAGTYLIQECREGESSYTQMFCSDIVFAS